MNKVIIGLVFSLCFFSLPAHSALVSYSGYTLDTDTKITTGDGLEWMQWSPFFGSTLSQPMMSYGADGWRLPNRTEMLTLLDAFSPVSVSAALENSEEFYHSIPHSIGDESTDNLIELMGDIGESLFLTPHLADDDQLSYTTAIFINSEEDDIIEYGHAEIYSDTARADGSATAPGSIRVDTSFRTVIGPFIEEYYQWSPLDQWLQGTESTSIALVREIKQVPELSASAAPISMLLLSLLLCLGLEQRKKQRFL